MLEFDIKGEGGEAKFFRTRVDPAQIERSRGRAAEEEFDDVIEAPLPGRKTDHRRHRCEHFEVASDDVHAVLG